MKRIGLALLILVLGLMLSITSVFAQEVEDVEASDYLFFFGGSAGGAAGSTEDISGLAVTPEGNILVADVYQHITEFNHYGELVTVHETDADGNSFGEITSMKFGPAGNLYVSTANPSVINVYDTEWALIQTITPEGENIMIEDLAYDSANDLLYAIAGFYNGSQVFAFNAEGELENSFPLQLDFPGNNQYFFGSLAVDLDGNILHGFGGIARTSGSLDMAAGAIQTYSPEGELLSQRDFTDYFERSDAMNDGSTEVFRFYPAAFGLTVDSVGRIYSYDVQQILGDPATSGARGIFSITASDGTLLRQFDVSQSDSPAGARVALSPDEQTLYVATQNYVHVISLTTEPEFTTMQLTDNARVRSGPDSSNELITTLPAGTIVLVTGTNEAGDWLQIRANGGEGWVASFLAGPVQR